MSRKILLLLAPLCLMATACVPGVGISTGDGSSSDELGSQTNDGEPGDSQSSDSQSSDSDFGVAVPGLIDLVLVYEWVFDFNLGVSLKDYAIARFDDGTYSRDLGTILNSGVAASKAENAGRWGIWEGNPGDDSFKLANSNGERELDLEASLSSDSIPDDLRLDRCYKSLTAVGLASTELGESGSALSSKEFCFQSNGVFTTTSSGSTLTPEMVGSSRSADAGIYQIDGNIIRLTFGNGVQEVQFFGAYSASEAQSVVSLNSSALTDRSE